MNSAGDESLIFPVRRKNINSSDGWYNKPYRLNPGREVNLKEPVFDIVHALQRGEYFYDRNGWFSHINFIFEQVNGSFRANTSIGDGWFYAWRGQVEFRKKIELIEVVLTQGYV